MTPDMYTNSRDFNFPAASGAFLPLWARNCPAVIAGSTFRASTSFHLFLFILLLLLESGWALSLKVPAPGSVGGTYYQNI